MRVVGCFLECDNKFVVLLRHAHKPDGATWGLPAGKVENNEPDSVAMVRELEEETGYRAALSEMEYLREDEFQFNNDPSFIFVVYRVKLANPHGVIMESSAHQKYRWIDPVECYNLPNLIPGFKKVLELSGYVK